MLALFAGQFAMAQNIYKGTVIDSTTRQPLDGACICANAKLRCTNKEGNFRISLPSDTSTLTITYIGYKTKVLSVKSN